MYQYQQIRGIAFGFDLVVGQPSICLTRSPLARYLLSNDLSTRLYIDTGSLLSPQYLYTSIRGLRASQYSSTRPGRVNLISTGPAGSPPRSWVSLSFSIYKGGLRLSSLLGTLLPPYLYRRPFYKALQIVYLLARGIIRGRSRYQDSSILQLKEQIAGTGRGQLKRSQQIRRRVLLRQLLVLVVLERKLILVRKEGE